MTGARLGELRAGLADVEGRIARACASTGRHRGDVTLVVVTKTFPAGDVRLLAGLGVVDVGEARDQEASAKAAELADLGLRWHFVGRLQTNKASSVASYADVVHSVDRERLVGALSRGARRAGRTVDCLVQVGLDTALDADPESGPAARGGARPADVPALAAAVAAADGLRLAGVMAVAPRDGDPADAFARLADVGALMRVDHPAATVVSAGMSGDLEAAVAAGATHLRVGSAVLGSRPPLH